MSLENICPSLLKEWDYKKNSAKPTELTIGSGVGVWWLCKNGHSWKNSPNKRIKGDKSATKCPYCSNRKLLKGFNDLATINPELAAEWDYGENKLKPTEITSGSQKEAFWKCSFGHRWSAVIGSRKKGHGCPFCNPGKVSQKETDLYNFIQSSTKEVILRNDKKILNGLEIDILIPKLKIGFEFNGDYWHSNERILATRGITADDYHENKKILAKSKGIDLYFVWENEWDNDLVETKKRVMNYGRP